MTLGFNGAGLALGVQASLGEEIKLVGEFDRDADLSHATEFIGQRFSVK